MSETMKCSVCKGTGKELFKHINPKDGEMIEELVECEMCGGKGFIKYKTDHGVLQTEWDAYAEEKYFDFSAGDLK